MKNHTKALLPLIAAALLTACDENNESFTSDTGTVEPQLVIDTSISSPDGKTLADFGFAAPTLEAFDLEVRSLEPGGDDANARWPQFAQLDPNMRFRSGAYLFTSSTPAMPEGFDAFTMSGEERVEVLNGRVTPFTITATLSRAIITTAYTRLPADGPVTAIELQYHSSGGSGYIAYPADESRPLLLNPGEMTAIATVTMADSRRVSFVAARYKIARATYYPVAVEVTRQGVNAVVTLTPGNGSTPVRTVVDEALLSAEAPKVTAEGFRPGVPLETLEGNTPSEPVAITVEADGSSAVASIVLSTSSADLAAAGFPAEVDLLNLTPQQEDAMRSAGLEWTFDTIDFTRLIASLRYSPSGSRNSFTVVASNSLGRVSQPVTLDVDVLDAELSVLSFSDAFIGVDHASAEIVTAAANPVANLAIEILGADGRWSQTAVNSVEKLSATSYNVDFAIPSDARSVDVRVLYCGRPKGEGTVRRVAPDFSIDVDAFARSAKVRVSAQSDILAAIIDNLTVYAGSTPLTVFSRDPETGIVEVLGLNPNTRYSIRATVMPMTQGDSDFSNTVECRTETTAALPNGAFDDIERSIRYDNLPSGGAYSQTIVDIHNCQNHTSYDINVPKGWANTNAKTFCLDARNKNTWYMQPSAQTVSNGNGGYSVKLTSTAWDLDGPEIMPYTQTSTPYLNYNPNIPEIAHRAAGRLWLGSYEFDPETCTETIKEGINFASRPSSLNGSYRYMPSTVSNSQHGLAMVKVWGMVEGREEVIAEGSVSLTVNPDYSSFKIPLAYGHFGVKATKITVVLASSDTLGDIDYETSHVLTYPDAVTATSTGNSLWVTDLTFAY